MSAELKALLDATQARCDGSMNAYYYSFEGTGIVPIDRVLSLVARAGKGSHHTDMWRDDKYGPSHEQRIQEAANESANEVRRLLAAAEAVLEEHRPTEVDALITDCSIEECDCEGDCTTEPVTVCAHCFGVGEESHPYAYEQGGIETVRYPCPTVTAIHAALIGGDDE